ncbi:MAG: hypothetical protein DYG98_25370 [Haliscomenobacteraceae bacterium CHB4]|nr:hypothetical protein [Haliscomenobacteraceae bacterium CHB4]
MNGRLFVPAFVLTSAGETVDGAMLLRCIVLSPDCWPKMKVGMTRFLKSSATIREFATKKGKMNDKMSRGFK